MKIFNQVLITNDDGFESEGIIKLKQILKSISQKVYIVAPMKNKSASGRSINLGKKIKFKRLSNFEWIVDGTPTDSMIFALNKIFTNKPPDFIFSGINNGTNIGDEISYSGTVAAAFEGALRGIPSIALSLARNNNNQKNFKVVEKFFPQVMSKINEIRFLDSSFFNVNFPNCDIKKVKEIIVTKMCHTKISDEIHVNMKNNYFEIGKMNVKTTHDINSDFYAIKQNFISITPISTNMTNNKYFDDI